MERLFMKTGSILQELFDQGITGAIIGKALYEKRLDLEEAVRRFQ